MSAADKVTRARARLVQEQPFFGCLALNLAMVERPDVETAATDGVHLFYSAAFVDSLSERELMGVMAHEVYHCALAHFARIGARDLRKWNEAADYAINPELIRAGFTLPRGVLNDPQWSGMSAEEIYSARQAQAQPNKPQAGQSAQAGQGKPSSGKDSAGQAQSGNVGQGAAAQAQPGKPGQSAGQGAASAGNGQESGDRGAATYGMGGIMRPGNGTEAAAKAIADQWQVRTRQAAAVAKRQAGTMPGFAQDALDELSAPVADFRDILAEFIDSRVATDYSWSRPNRRFASAGVYLPSAQADALDHLIIAFDTSGSITPAMVTHAASEIAGAMDSGKVAKVTILYADTAVRHVQEFVAGDEITAATMEVRGGGGTRFDDSFRWIREHAQDATAAIYITDMDCSKFGDDPEIPLIWAIHGTRKQYATRAARAPFGDCVYIGRLD